MSLKSFKIRWRKVLRELWNNKSRTVLVVMSIAVGVFATGTIITAWIVLNKDYGIAYSPTNQPSAVMSITPDFEDGLVDAVAGRRDVAQAEGRRTIIATVFLSPQDSRNIEMTAVEDFDDIQIQRFMPESGAWPPLTRQVLLERSWEGETDFQIGDAITIETNDGREYDLVLGGYVHDLNVAPAGDSDRVYAYISFETMEYIGEPRTYNQLLLTVAEDRLDKQYLAEVATDVRERTIEQAGFVVGSTFIPSSPGQGEAFRFLQAFLIVLGVVGAFSLLLSGSLVTNTISALLAQQVRQIGVMKAIGGRFQQILEIYLATVLIYGLLALLVGIPLGVIGARGLINYQASDFNFDVSSTGIPLAALLVQVSVGLLVPIAAAIVPVLSQTRITVREALSDSGIETKADMNKSLIDRTLQAIRGLPRGVMLSLRNTFRRKSRLILTLFTLTLAGAVFMSVLSLRRSLYASLDVALQYLQYDISVNLGESYRETTVAREVERIPGVTSVEGWAAVTTARVRPDDTQGSNAIIAGGPLESEYVTPTLLEGRWLRPEDDKAIVINVDFLTEEPDVAIGDTITLDIEGDESGWEVVGLITSQYAGSYIYAPYDAVAGEIGRPGLVNQIFIKTASSEPAYQQAIATEIEDRLKRAGLEVGTVNPLSEFIQTLSGYFDTLVVALSFIAVLLAIVGGLGLAGTMSLNVLERTREVGVMRAVGASNGAIRQIVLAEGVFVGIISWVLAILLSLPLSQILCTSVGLAFARVPLDFIFEPIGAAVWLAFALVIASVASFAPAQRAARLSVRETLAYE